MRNTGVILRKELTWYLSSPMAYVVTAVFLAVSGAFFVVYLVGTDYMDTSIAGFLNAARIMMLLFAALLTMRLVADEKRTGTWELMLTAPVTEVEIVLGKFFSSLVVLCGMLVLTFYYPVLLLILGDPDVGPMATSYVGLFLLGSASLAVGVFASSLSTSQVIAAVVAGAILFGLWFLGAVGDLIQGGLGELLSYLSISHYFPDFVRGVIDTRAVVYYLSITATFLFLAVQSVQGDRWR